MAYLLECACGRQFTVTAGAAGTAMTCGCGRTVPVPPLSSLRDLPEAADPRPAAAETAEPDRWFARTALSVGALVSGFGCAASLVAAAWGPFMARDGWGWAYLPAGAVGFFYNAGMFLVFVRAMR
jgi:hypothetical protein